jgi:DNA-binding MarR family transcriptional regulator
MERDGWIRRDGDKQDRRRKYVEVLPAAKPVWKKIVAVAKRVRARASRGMTPTQLAQLKKLLTVVQGNLRDGTEQREAG